MAFMLRVDFKCPSAEITSTVLDSLKVMADVQLGPPGPHPGLIVYHFARPDPHNEPNRLEFTEVYANETTFWGHSAHPEFISAYYKGFDPDNNSQSVTRGYGPGMKDKVKKTCDAVLKCQYPKTTGGFVLNPEKWNLKATSGDQETDGPVMLIFSIQAEESKVQDVIQALCLLSEVANDGVIVCFASVVEPDSNPAKIELVEVCAANTHLIAHLEKGKQSLISVSQSATSIACNAYGQVSPQMTQLLSETIGLQVVSRKTDAGYVLHPDADPFGK